MPTVMTLTTLADIRELVQRSCFWPPNRPPTLGNKAESLSCLVAVYKHPFLNSLSIFDFIGVAHMGRQLDIGKKRIRTRQPNLIYLPGPSKHLASADKTYFPIQIAWYVDTAGAL
jgi:hypothetical protein